LVVCGWSISDLVEKYQEKKIVVGLGNTRRHISEIPHPAIVFCFEIFKSYDGFNYQEFQENANEEIIKTLTGEQYKIRN
jgi:hypothetical protein